MKVTLNILKLMTKLILSQRSGSFFIPGLKESGDLKVSKPILKRYVIKGNSSKVSSLPLKCTTDTDWYQLLLGRLPSCWDKPFSFVLDVRGGQTLDTKTYPFFPQQERASKQIVPASFWTRTFLLILLHVLYLTFFIK